MFSPAPRGSTDARPEEEISFDEGFIAQPIVRQAAVSVEQIDRLLEQLVSTSVMELSANKITSRKRTLATLPRTIRRLKRQVVIAERRLKELEEQELTDDQWNRLMDERRMALQMIAHDIQA